jgi:2-hydroxychromene-2-carboxylate isomerase
MLRRAALPMPTLYFDLGSPYAYLAFMRADSLFGRMPELAPVLLGAIFERRGSGSWSQTPARAERIAELHERVRAYGMAPLKFPPGWPGNGLYAMRAATWALGQSAGEEFARAAFQRSFAAGEDITGVPALASIAEQIGLSGAELQRGVASVAVKDALRAATDAAWAAGVRGVPSVRVAAGVFYGDDQLERAAAG